MGTDRSARQDAIRMSTRVLNPKRPTIATTGCVSVSWDVGDLVDMFKACNLAFKHDVQTARFLLPYIVQNAVACGSDAALVTVKSEMELVLQKGPATREGELCVQEVY